MARLLHRSLRGTACAGGLALLAGCSTVSGLFDSGPEPQSSTGAHAVAVQRSLEYLPDTETFDWTDPETGRSARLTVLSTAQSADGRYCRDVRYQADISVEGVVQSYCRNEATGDWVAEN